MKTDHKKQCQKRETYVLKYVGWYFKNYDFIYYIQAKAHLKYKVKID